MSFGVGVMSPTDFSIGANKLEISFTQRPTVPQVRVITIAKDNGQSRESEPSPSVGDIASSYP
jgi:hypothetical protein